VKRNCFKWLQILSKTTASSRDEKINFETQIILDFMETQQVSGITYDIHFPLNAIICIEGPEELKNQQNLISSLSSLHKCL
jgi:hypothetical protein